MANENNKDPVIPAKPQPQRIPLTKIHDLPGIFVPKMPDKSYGGLVSSIQTSGVKEAVILRQREDGEYQLVEGYRRRRASELAKQQDIPAFVYEMSLQEAIGYHKQVKVKADTPIPGKLLDPKEKAAEPVKPAPDAPKKEEQDKGQTKEAAAPVMATAEKKPDPEQKPASGTPTSGEKPKEAEKAPEPAKPTTAAPKETEKADVPAKSAEVKKAETGAPAADGNAKEPEKNTEPVKAAEKKDTPTKEGAAPGKPEEAKKPDADGKPKDPEKTAEPAKTAAPAPKEPEKAATPKAGEKQAAVPAEKPKEAEKPAAVPKSTSPGKEDKEKAAPAVSGPAAKGPAGTAISQVFAERLAPPSEKDLKDLPVPKEGESFFIVLHPGYLEKSEYNRFSVDKSSENYKELRKSIEQAGIHDPVLTRHKPGGGLEILSGQRRHMVASELNYPVPAIIQKIDDADAKIIVADGNLHRDKISTFDLSRALRMKMEGMKQKAGRKKKSDLTAEAMNSDEKLATEMGMSVSKLNRILRLSEAAREVCDRVDDGTLPLSIASSISFLKPSNQDEVMHLMDLGYKVSTERVEYLKKVEKAGKLDEKSMRQVLEGKNILEPPKVTTPPPVSAPAAKDDTPPWESKTQAPTPAAPAPATTAPTAPAPTAPAPTPAAPTIPPSPDVKMPENVTFQSSKAPAADTPAPTVNAAAPASPAPAKEEDITKGAQERPEHTKVILTGDRLRRYYPDVSMTPREIEEDIYSKLEFCRQRDEMNKQKEALFKKPGHSR